MGRTEPSPAPRPQPCGPPTPSAPGRTSGNPPQPPHPADAHRPHRTHHQPGRRGLKMLRLRKETRCVSSCRYRPDSVRFESRVVKSWSIHSSPTILLALALLGAVAAMTLVIGGTIWGLKLQHIIRKEAIILQKLHIISKPTLFFSTSNLKSQQITFQM